MGDTAAGCPGTDCFLVIAGGSAQADRPHRRHDTVVLRPRHPRVAPHPPQHLHLRPTRTACVAHARPARQPRPLLEPIRVQRRVSATGTIMAVGQKMALRRTHARTVVTVHVADTSLTIEAGDGTRTFTPHDHQARPQLQGSPARQGRPTRSRPTEQKAILCLRQFDSSRAIGSLGRQAILRLGLIELDLCDRRSRKPKVSLSVYTGQIVFEHGSIEHNSICRPAI